jgi:hypothetical protein
MRRMGLRWGVSLGMVLVVAAVVVVARLAGGDRDRDRRPYYPGTDATPSVAATVGDDGEVAPTTDAYSDDAAVRAAASIFTTAWLRRSLPADVWLDGLRPLATPNLLQNLTGVDPVDVPSATAPGEPAIRVRSDLYADVRVPIGSDAIRLGMLKQDDHWLVDTVDRDE